MATTPCNTSHSDNKQDSEFIENGHVRDRINGSSDDDDGDSSASEDDDDSVELREELFTVNTCVAIACDDGCVPIYSFSDQLMYNKSLPRVNEHALSVTWSLDENKIYSGSSDGFIRCWDARNAYEINKITAGLGGLGSGTELCIWSLIALRCGTLVSADSSGSVQFWDTQLGILLQAHSCHKGDVNALAAVPSHNRVFFCWFRWSGDQLTIGNEISLGLDGFNF